MIESKECMIKTIEQKCEANSRIMTDWIYNNMIQHESKYFEW